MKLSAFELGLKEDIKHAPDPQTQSDLQAIYDRTHGSGAQTNLEDGGSGQTPK